MADGAELPKDQLGKNEAQRLAEILEPGETVVGICVGQSGQAVVMTEARVLIVKTGFQPKGNRGSAFEYSQIESVSAPISMGSGVFQINTASSVGFMKAHEHPSAIPFGKKQAGAKFDIAVDFIKNRSSAVRAELPPGELERTSASTPPINPPEKASFWDRMQGIAQQEQERRRQVEANRTVEVKRYKNAKEYEHDAQKMIRAGWRMQGQSEGRGKVNMGRTVLKAGVLLPWAVMRPSRKDDPLTVTWVREPAGQSAAEAPAAPSGDDVLGKLRELGALRDSGIVTEDEFEVKKAELLARL